MKPTYEELQQRVAELEKEALDCRSAGASLRWSNEIVNSILSASPIGIGLVENRIIKRVNGALMRLFHFESEADFIGQSARIMYPSEEDFQRVGDFIYTYLKAGKEAWLDAMFRRKDGTTFWGHLKVNTLHPADPMQRATFTISDISWRKRAEAKLLQNEKLQAIVEMAGAVCHEMNQPMQLALVELAELLVLDFYPKDEIEKRVARIRKPLNSLRDMSRKLMHITRYETRDYVEGGRIVDISRSTAAVINSIWGIKKTE